MRHYLILPKNNKADFRLMLGILRLENLSCLEKLCVYLSFIVWVMKWIYLHICWRNMTHKRYIQT